MANVLSQDEIDELLNFIDFTKENEEDVIYGKDIPNTENFSIPEGKKFFYLGLNICTNKSLKKLYFPSTIKTITSDTFQYFPNLEKIEIDSRNETFFLENGILYEKLSSGLKRMKFAPPNALSSILRIDGTTDFCEVFHNQNIEHIEFLKNTKSLDNNAISNAITKVKSIFISKDIDDINPVFFENSDKCEEISVEDGNCKFYVQDNFLFEKNNSERIFLRKYFGNETILQIPSFVDIIDAYSIPERVVSINIPKLSTVILNNSVKNENAKKDLDKFLSKQREYKISLRKNALNCLESFEDCTENDIKEFYDFLYSPNSSRKIDMIDFVSKKFFIFGKKAILQFYVTTREKDIAEKTENMKVFLHKISEAENKNEDEKQSFVEKLYEIAEDFNMNFAVIGMPSKKKRKVYTKISKTKTFSQDEIDSLLEPLDKSFGI